MVPNFKLVPYYINTLYEVQGILKYLQLSILYQYFTYLKDTPIMQLEKLVGPVYDVEHKSGFQDIIQNVEKIKNLTGPVYDVAHSNVFKDVLKGVEKVLSFVGQVFCHRNINVTLE